MGLISLVLQLIMGTRTIFRKNGAIDPNSCPKCGSDAYVGKGRLFFHILFIPLIPIEKYEVLYKCTKCRHKFE